MTKREIGRRRHSDVREQQWRAEVAAGRVALSAEAKDDEGRGDRQHRGGEQKLELDHDHAGSLTWCCCSVANT